MRLHLHCLIDIMFHFLLYLLIFGYSNSSFQLAIRIWDIDKGGYITTLNTEARFNVTSLGPGTTEISSAINYSNDTGYVVYDFNPSCSYTIGPQKRNR